MTPIRPFKVAERRIDNPFNELKVPYKDNPLASCFRCGRQSKYDEKLYRWKGIHYCDRCYFHVKKQKTAQEITKAKVPKYEAIKVDAWFMDEHQAPLTATYMTTPTPTGA